MSAAIVFEIFHELREQGRTVLVVSHDREILTDVPRLMVLTDGVIEGTTLEAAARRRSQELQAVKLRTQERRAAHTDTQEHKAVQQ
jgi:ABC-type Mn2+/Zn2+ transport system ATPase subunit